MYSSPQGYIHINHFPNYKKAVEEAGTNFVWQNTKMKSALIQL